MRLFRAASVHQQKKLKRDAPDSKLEDVAAFATLKLGHKGV